MVIMACYIEKIREPSHSEYAIWQSIGFTGSYEQYVGQKTEVGATMFICGDLGDHCSDCNGFGDFLCDYPVGLGKTCDRAMCTDHAHEVAPEIHYCEGHYKMWLEFKNSGGVDESLRNVIAFKAEK